MHRFIIPNQIIKGDMEIVDSEIVHQIKNVLRLQVGEKIVLSGDDLLEAEAIIKMLDKKSIHVNIDSVRKNQSEPPRQVTLYVALLKKENFEWVAQKATEVGATEVIPLLTARTVKKNFVMSRLKKIIKEAAEQSGRGRIPKVSEPLSWAESWEDSKRHQINLFCDFSGVNFSEMKLPKDISVGVFVGPEGGWTDEERKDAAAFGATAVTLAKTILRGETAAVVASHLAAWL